MAKRLPIYLRTYRLQWGLTQTDLAILLGVSKDAISKYECGRRTPPTAVILTMQIVFGVSVRDLFPAMHNRIENQLVERVIELEGVLDGRTDARSLKRRALVESVFGRLHELGGRQAV